MGIGELIFALTLLCTFGAAVLARKRGTSRTGQDALAGRNLNRWLIGLSAATTANSGFIVTGAVGLGYAFGLQWLLLPLSWLCGDLIFWYFFPERINRLGREFNATTLSELMQGGLNGRLKSALSIVSAVIILACLAGYTSAQWLAGQKFLAGAFGLSSLMSLGAFALVITAYSSIGGFLGSIYTDTVQAVIRIVGTVIAVGGVAGVAVTNRSTFVSNIAAAGPDFLHLFPDGLVATVGFILGYACAAIGFGLGQPQIMSRYLAGRTPEETRSAWPIYIAFVQCTWIAMTVFGVLLRGVMPNISDPETGLSVFFHQYFGPAVTGLIAADIFATIASTSNGLLISMAQVVNYDLVQGRLGTKSSLPIGLTTAVLGGITMALSLVTHGTVMSIALGSLSIMGAAVGAAVMIKVLRWPHNGSSLLVAISLGFISAALWRYCGLSAAINETAVGMMLALGANYFMSRRNIAREPVKSGSSLD